MLSEARCTTRATGFLETTPADYLSPRTLDYLRSTFRLHSQPQAFPSIRANSRMRTGQPESLAYLEGGRIAAQLLQKSSSLAAGWRKICRQRAFATVRASRSMSSKSTSGQSSQCKKKPCRRELKSDAMNLILMRLQNTFLQIVAHHLRPREGRRQSLLSKGVGVWEARSPALP